MNTFVKLIFAGMLMLLAGFMSCSSEPKVTLTEDERTYTMSNGIISVMISKESGDLVSLRYLTKDGIEMLGTFLTPDGLPDLEKDPPGANPNGLNRGMTDHQYGFWSHDAMGPRDTRPAIATVTIDPSKNGGKMAEVSIKGISEGRKMGTGPGSRQEGQFVADIDIRFTLERGASGIYTYCIFNHKDSYPYTALTEARFCTKLADFFDWMSVDATRNKYYPKELNEGDKYIYTVVQSKNRAFGWSSTTKNVGLFFINPSMEYMSGGPTKVEFLGHRDTNPVAAPCVLNYWRSSHYGGAEVNVAEGEEWIKIIGPFMIYVNSDGDSQTLYDDAKAHAVVEAAKWPYKWVNDASYPLAKDRATVTGKFVLNDPMTSPEFVNLHVGLTAPAYVSPRPAGQPEVMIDWQKDAKHYQFWNLGNADGTFSIANVRPGKYTLHAFADGILGELAKTDIIVEKGKSPDLGTIEWKPVRKGVQIWDIGIPNRNASEFFMGDQFTDPLIVLKYPELFPNDITFVIGKNDFRKDWFFIHVPHNTDPDAAISFYNVSSASTKATPYIIMFDMPSAPKGKATLRFAICGTAARNVDVSVNGIEAGSLSSLPSDNAISLHVSSAIWYEREVVFDAALMKQGTNKIVITVPEGPVTNGMKYDYIRLELDENTSVSVP